MHVLFGLPSHITLGIILIVVLLLFGNRLPSLMRSLGRSVNEFKKGIGDEDDQDDDNDRPKVNRG